LRFIHLLGAVLLIVIGVYYMSPSGAKRRHRRQIERPMPGQWTRSERGLRITGIGLFIVGLVGLWIQVTG
jgi:hypothetical protein